MTAALPHGQQTVAELEAHLREHIAARQRAGSSEDEAFAAAEQRLGEPEAVAREFNRLPSRWRPAGVLLSALGLGLAFLAGASVWAWSRRLSVTPLQLAAIAGNLAGAYGILGSGLIGSSALVTAWRRPLTDGERRAVRRLLRKLVLLGAVSLPIGILLTTIWRAHVMGDQWAASSYFVRMLAYMAALALLVRAERRSTQSDTGLWVAAIFASLVLMLCGNGPRARVADVPVAWFGAAFLAGQVFLALPRFRIVRVPETN